VATSRRFLFAAVLLLNPTLLDDDAFRGDASRGGPAARLGVDDHRGRGGPTRVFAAACSSLR
jgi:hypothetical protein